MNGIVVALERLGGKLELLAHCVKEEFKRLDTGRVLSGFEPADRRLASTGATSEALLAEPVTPTRIADQFGRSHA
jgi:hypothetical protein